jgi:hypothetical protein
VTRAQRPTTAAPLTALIVTFAGGRSVSHPIQAGPAQTWTPVFPRVPGWKPKPGQELVTELGFEYARQGSNVHVDVFVRTAGSRVLGTSVDSVTLRPGDRVVVNHLRDVGLEAVDLSLAPVTPVSAREPALINATQGLAMVGVEMLSTEGLIYRVTVKNLSEKAARVLQVQSFRDGRPALFGARKGAEGRPFIAPHGTATFDMRTPTSRGSTGAVTPLPLDAIGIASVVWQDGTFEGDQNSAARNIAVDDGERWQLRRVIEVLDSAANGALSDGAVALSLLKAAVERLPASATPEMIATEAVRMPPQSGVTDRDLFSLLTTGLQFVKGGLFAEVQTFERDRPAVITNVVLRDWMVGRADRYRSWLRRLEVK